MTGRLAETYVFPASFAQQRLWFLCQLNPDAHRAYHMSVAFDVDGAVDVNALATALDVLVARHEIMRTRFVMFDEAAERLAGELCQVIEPIGTIPVERRAVEDAEVDRVLTEDHEFALDALPLAKFRVLDRPGGGQVLQLVAHHLIFDGWSVSVFLDELSAVYSALVDGRTPDLPDPQVQYADFAEWQRDRVSELDADLGYWHERLAGVPSLELPTDRPRPERQSFRGARQAVSLPLALALQVEELATAERATPFMVLLAAWDTVLATWTGQPDFAVGTPVAGRERPELERGIGMFVNTVALRADLGGAPTFRELVRRTRDTCLDAFARQEVPFERVVQRVVPRRDLRRSPVFQVFFAVQNVSMPVFTLPGCRFTPRDVPRHTAMFDLRLSLHSDAGALSGWLEYSRDLFDEPAILALSRQWLDLTAALLADPDRPIPITHVEPVAIPQDPDPATQPAGPRTPLEAELLAIFRRLLGRDDVDVNTSFFDQGGTSLLAVRAMRQIRRKLRVSVPVETIFSLTSVAGLARAIESPELMAATPDSEGILEHVDAMWRTETQPNGEDHR